MNHLSDQYLLNPNQHGFRKGMSSESQLFELVGLASTFVCVVSSMRMSSHLQRGACCCCCLGRRRRCLDHCSRMERYVREWFLCLAASLGLPAASALGVRSCAAFDCGSGATNGPVVLDRGSSSTPDTRVERGAVWEPVFPATPRKTPMTHGRNRMWPISGGPRGRRFKARRAASAYP